MKCITCGNEVSSNDSVCPVCGTSKAVNMQIQETGGSQNIGHINGNQQKQGSFCMMCGKPVPLGYKMCPECMNLHITEKSAPRKKKSYAWLIILLSVLILLVGAVAVGFGTGIIPTMISDLGAEETEIEENRNDEELADENSGEEEKNNGNGTENDAENKQNGTSIESKPKETVCEIVVPELSDSIITWSNAAYNAKKIGGELASINSREEFDKITADANEKNLVILWVGAQRKDGQMWEDVKWLDGTEMSFTKWLDKEPSYESDGEKEYYLMLVKIGQNWYFNDTADDITSYYSHLSDKVGFVIEKEK